MVHVSHYELFYDAIPMQGMSSMQWMRMMYSNCSILICMFGNCYMIFIIILLVGLGSNWNQNVFSNKRRCHSYIPKIINACNFEMFLFEFIMLVILSQNTKTNICV